MTIDSLSQSPRAAALAASLQKGRIFIHQGAHRRVLGLPVCQEDCQCVPVERRGALGQSLGGVDTGQGDHAVGQIRMMQAKTRGALAQLGQGQLFGRGKVAVGVSTR